MGNSGASYALASEVRPALGYSSTRIDYPPRMFCSGTHTLTAGSAFFTLFEAPINLTVGRFITGGGGTAAVASTLCRIGLYTADGSDALTLVARTANNTALWAVSNTQYTEAFATAGGYPATYAMVAGVRYAFGLIVVGASTPPSLRGNTMNPLPADLLPALMRRATSQTDLATSITPGGLATGGGIPWVAVTA